MFPVSANWENRVISRTTGTRPPSGNIVQKTCDEYGPNLVPVRNIGQFDDLCGNDSNAGGLCSMSWVCVNKETGIPFESENDNNITK